MSINKIYFIWILLFITLSCKKEQETTLPVVKFIHIVDYSEGVVIDTLAFTVHESHVNNKYKYAYTTNNDYTIYYDIDFENYNGRYYDSKDTCELKYKSKKKYILYPEQKCLDIYLYSKKTPDIDDDFDFYFTPSIGLVLKKSTTWHNVMQLFSVSNFIQNDSLSILIPLIYLDLYYSKECKEIPPIP